MPQKIENQLQIKILCQKVILDRAFSIVNISKGSNYFPGKIKIDHLKYTRPNQNCIVCLAEHQTLKIIPQIRLIFNFQVYGLPPLHIQNDI